MKLSRYISLIVLLHWLSLGYSQPVSYLGIERGLSNNTVTCIYKDRKGFMWFGTLDGLNRYDGYTITKIRSRAGDSSSLPDNYISAIAEDDEGSFWIATQSGIGILNSLGKFRTASYESKKENIKRWLRIDQPVNDLKKDHNGGILVAATNLGFLYSRKENTVANRVPLSLGDKQVSNYSARAIEADGRNNAWVAVDNAGLCFYDSGTGKFQRLSGFSNTINCIRSDQSGNLWIGTNAGLYFYNVRNHQCQSINLNDNELNQSRILGISFDPDGKLWVATDGNGLIVFDVKTRSVLRKIVQENSGSVTSNSIYSVCIDELGRKWIGTMRGGVNIIDSRKARFKTIQHEAYNKNSLIHNITFSFCEDGNDVWIGTDGGGISVWNRKYNTFKSYVHNPGNPFSLQNNQVTSIIKDRKGDIYVASYGAGVSRFNRSNGHFDAVPFDTGISGSKYVWKLYLDSEGNIWAGCIRGRRDPGLRKGLFKLNKEKGRFVNVSFPLFSEVLSIIDDRDGNLWIGTLTEVVRINKKTGKLTFLNLKSYVRSLHISRTGRLWIGTAGRGLFYIDHKII